MLAVAIVIAMLNTLKSTWYRWASWMFFQKH